MQSLKQVKHNLIIMKSNISKDVMLCSLVEVYPCFRRRGTYCIHLQGTLLVIIFFYYLVCEATGTAATPGLLCQPRVTVKMIVKRQMECRLAGETEVLGENLPQRNFRPSQNPT
jgi:hypothetical protein